MTLCVNEKSEVKYLDFQVWVSMAAGFMVCPAVCAAGPLGRANPKRVCFRRTPSALDPEGMNPGVLLGSKLENLVLSWWHHSVMTPVEKEEKS